MTGTSTYKNRLYRWAVAMVGAYIVSEFDGEDGYFSWERLQSKEFAIEYGSSLLIAIILLEIIAWTTRLLDRRYHWQDNFPLRAFLQILFGVGVPVLADLLLATLYFRIFQVNILDTNYIQQALPFIVSLIALFNVCYVFYFFILRVNSIKGTTKDADAFGTPFFIATKGIVSHSVPATSVACFYRRIDQSFLWTLEKEEYALSQSLDSVEKALPAEHFFRATRKLIINLRTVKSFKPMKSGKILLDLEPAVPHELSTTVSREKATVFRKRMQHLQKASQG